VIDPRSDLAALPPLAAMQAWLERAVIGLNLCPFAKAAARGGGIRWVLSDSTDEEALLADLVAELHFLAATPAERVETTLIVHPRALNDFEAYNQFLDVADAALAALGLEGRIQIASFHPGYRFAGAAADDITNCTNRAPYPALHLLRETSVERAVAAFPDAASIVEHNLRTLRRLGWPGWLALWLAR
jgi:uncharacterized protein